MLGGAGSHRGRTCATEPAARVAWGAIAFRLELTATRTPALAMLVFGLMEGGPNALEINVEKGAIYDESVINGLAPYYL